MDFVMKMDFLMKNGSGTHGSILDRLSTGNVWVDTVVAAIIPVAMRYFLPARSYKPVSGYLAIDAIFLAVAPVLRAKRRHILARLRAGGANIFYGMRNTYETTIRFQKEGKNLIYGAEEASAEDSEEGRRNNILQKAILLYIGHLDLEHRRSQALLTAIKQKPSSNGQSHSGMDRYGRPKPPKVFGGTAEQLKSFSISIAPPEDVWVQVDKESGVWFKQTKAVSSASGGRDSGADRETTTTIEYAFWCARIRGNARIKAFINGAYEWYAEEMKSTEDHARYMYSLIAQPEPPRLGLPMAVGGIDFTGMGGDPRGKKSGLDGSPLRYRRYKLGDGKDFDSLFFPEKDSLLKTLANFEAKKGKYAIKGYPHKLGLLLHGPPGTGKTSLIKALAYQTGRHIIQVPLGRVNTNQDLMNIMLDESFPVAKQDLPVSLKHENVIFVFEDVDTASKIVKARSSWNSSSSSSRTLTNADTNDSSNFLRFPKAGVGRPGRSGRTKRGNYRGRGKMSQKQGGKGEGGREGGGKGGSEKNKVTPICSGAAEPAPPAAAAAATPPKSLPVMSPPLTESPSTSEESATQTPPIFPSSPASEEGTPVVVVTAASAAITATETTISVAEEASAEKAEARSTAVGSKSSSRGLSKGGWGERRGRRAQNLARAAGGEGEGEDSDEDKEDDDGDNGDASGVVNFSGDCDGNGSDDQDNSSSSSSSSNSNSTRGGGTAKKDAMGKSTTKSRVKYANKYDKLDLSGLLNVLDGVVDTPGRIVILTTNVVNVLDRALIRPGRIDKTILLGYMRYEAALQMTLHFFPEEGESLTDEQKSRLKAVFSDGSAARRRGRPSLNYGSGGDDGGELTPATVEQMLGEHDTVHDFLDALEGLAV